MSAARAPVPALRIAAANAAPLRPGRAFVLYWMIAARRTAWSFALDRALEHARALDRPLVILEPLRVNYPFACDRFHRFVLDGMAENARRLAGSRVLHHPYVEPAPGAARGLLEALASLACVVVTDELPCFFLPRMVAAAARRLDVRLEAVDSNGLLPLRAAPREFATAASFRRFVQKTLLEEPLAMPAEAPLSGLDTPPAKPLAAELSRRWPAADAALLEGSPAALARLPIDHEVGAVEQRGGSAEARRALARFLEGAIDGYPSPRDPEKSTTSRLSPYLHFGHASAHEVFSAVAAREGWTRDRLAPRATGSRAGFWGLRPGAEAFLDQLVTWRELSLNLCFRRPTDHARYESLPAWARRTLEAHAADPRPRTYPEADLLAARTHDPLWNAAQTQLAREGWYPNHLRMLWGKKILEWSPTPRAALERMERIMNRLSLDGRDPSSYAGYGWTLGRFDRPWGPERPIFGLVRYMSSESTGRKLRAREYVKRYAPRPGE